MGGAHPRALTRPMSLLDCLHSDQLHVGGSTDGNSATERRSTSGRVRLTASQRVLSVTFAHRKCDLRLIAAIQSLALKAYGLLAAGSGLGALEARMDAALDRQALRSTPYFGPPNTCRDGRIPAGTAITSINRLDLGRTRGDLASDVAGDSSNCSAAPASTIDGKAGDKQWRW